MSNCKEITYAKLELQFQRGFNINVWCRRVNDQLKFMLDAHFTGYEYAQFQGDSLPNILLQWCSKYITIRILPT